MIQSPKLGFQECLPGASSRVASQRAAADRERHGGAATSSAMDRRGPGRGPRGRGAGPAPEEDRRRAALASHPLWEAAGSPRGGRPGPSSGAGGEAGGGGAATTAAAGAPTASLWWNVLGGVAAVAGAGLVLAAGAAYAAGESVYRVLQGDPEPGSREQVAADEALARRLQAEEDALDFPSPEGEWDGIPASLEHTLPGLSRLLRSAGEPMGTLSSSRGPAGFAAEGGASLRLNLPVSGKTGGSRARGPHRERAGTDAGGRGQGGGTLLIGTGGLGGGFPGGLGALFAGGLQELGGDNMSYEELLELEERLGGQAHRGATDAVIEALPLHRWTRADGKEEEACCSICLSDFENGDEVRTLPCSHQFHAACVDRWLKTNRACPVCKADVC